MNNKLMGSYFLNIVILISDILIELLSDFTLKKADKKYHEVSKVIQ